MHLVYFGWIFVVRITKLTPLKPMTFCFSFQVAGLHSHSETENPLVRRQNHHDPWLVPLIRMCKLRVTSEKKKKMFDYNSRMGTLCMLQKLHPTRGCDS